MKQKINENAVKDSHRFKELKCKFVAFPGKMSILMKSVFILSYMQKEFREMEMGIRKSHHLFRYNPLLKTYIS